MIKDDFLALGEYAAAGLYEEQSRSLFYRKALGLRRYFENCAVPEYNGKLLYPSGRVAFPDYMTGMPCDADGLRECFPEAADRVQHDFGGYKSYVPSKHTVAGNMYIHSMPNYERILHEGLLSYIPRIKRSQILICGKACCICWKASENIMLGA